MKTGRGKTHLIFWLITHFKVPTLILCHNIKQAHDTYEKIKAFTNISESDLSLITSKAKRNQNNKEARAITITTHKGFVEKNKEIFKENFVQIIYDECDYNLSFPKRQEYDGCMSSALILSKPNLLWGMTGTPYRNIVGAEPLTKLIGQIIFKPDQKNNGYNILPHIYQLKYYGNKSYVRDSWSELRTQMFQDKHRVSAQLDTINKFSRKQNLILLEQIDEVEFFYEKIKEKNSKTVMFHSQLNAPTFREQTEYLEKLRESKEFTIIGTIDMLGRGIDIPEIDTVFLFASVKFEGTVVQAIGRGLRSTTTDKIVNVYDRLDLPLLIKQSQEREKAYMREYTEKVLIDTLYIKGEKRNVNAD